MTGKESAFHVYVVGRGFGAQETGEGWQISQHGRALFVVPRNEIERRITFTPREYTSTDICEMSEQYAAMFDLREIRAYMNEQYVKAREASRT